MQVLIIRYNNRVLLVDLHCAITLVVFRKIAEIGHVRKLNSLPEMQQWHDHQVKI